MNRIYRVVYNHHTETCQAVSEHGKGRHKTQSQTDGTHSPDTRGGVPFLPTALALTLAVSGVAQAAPSGGEVVRGEAHIRQQGKLTDIQQHTPKAVINWQKFGIKPDETVRFRQPDAQSLMLNRVTGRERSAIDGALQANGKIFIQNPNGVMIGKDAKINVGSLVATTAAVSDDDFMAGRLRFQHGQGQIANSGNITVPAGGTVALIAPIVKNQGRITAPQGNALLASAEAFTLQFDGDHFSYTLDKGTLQGLVDNGGAVIADGGRIVLTAQGTDAVKQSLIKHSGIAQAHTVQNKNGVIELLGDLENTRLEVSGSLKAEAKEGGDGGLIETSAAKVNIADGAEISTRAEHGKTGQWLIDPADFTVHPSSMNRNHSGIGASTLESSLNSNNVQLSTAAGGSGAGDIHINAPVSWNKNSLTLTAHNNININADLNGSGSAKLGLEYGQATADGGQSDYHLKKGVKVNLPAGDSFSLKKGSAGETETFTVFHQMPEISRNNGGKYTAAFSGKNIAIGKDMDLSYTESKQDGEYKQNSFAGWALPEGAKVHGLGHTLSNLKIDTKAENAGLFQQLTRGEIRHLGVKDADVSVSSSYSSYAGGLVGRADNATISHSHAHANVSASYSSSSSAAAASAGGLVGRAYDTTISHSYADANVSSSSSYAGGLVGYARNATISHSYADANVSSYYYSAGGLVGSAGNTNISHSYADANVSSSYAGGLVGSAYNTTISHSYADANVSSPSNLSSSSSSVGGLVGYAVDTNISHSYADANVSASSNSSNSSSAAAGGLVGRAWDTNISHSYADANVSSSSSSAAAAAGGLVGRAWDTNISHSYALSDRITAVSEKGDSYIGGLIGWLQDNSTLSRSYYDISRAGVADAVGSLKNWNGKVTATISNASGQSTAQMQKPSTYQGWDFDKVWRIADGTYPRLRSLTEGVITIDLNPNLNPNPTKPDIQAKANDLSKTYDGEALTVTNPNDPNAPLRNLKGWGKNGITINGLKDGDTLSEDDLKALRFDGKGSNWVGAVNAGKYTLVPWGLDLQKYEVKYANGTLTIDKAPLKIYATKEYDGTNTARIYDNNDFKPQVISLDGRLSIHDDVSVKENTSGSLSGINVGNHTVTDLGTLTLVGKDAKNYRLIKNGSTWEITKKPVRLAGTRTYDGTDWIDAIDLEINKNDVLQGDELFFNVYSGAIYFDNKNVNPDGKPKKIKSVEKIELFGKGVDNYKIDVDNSKIFIKPIVAHILVSKQFDGNKIFDKDFIITNKIDGDKVGVRGSLIVTDANASSNKKEVLKNNLTVHNNEENNYAFIWDDKDTVSAKINPKEIQVFPFDRAKFYNQPDPEFDFVHEKLLGNDKISGFLTRELGEDVGAYKIKLGSLSAGENYRLILNGKQNRYLTINPLPIIVRINNQEYDPAWYNPVQGVTASLEFDRKDISILIPNNNLTYPALENIKFKGRLDLANSDRLNLFTPQPGDYEITPGSIKFSDNYDVVFIPGKYKVHGHHEPVVGEIRAVMFGVERLGLAIGKEAVEMGKKPTMAIYNYMKKTYEEMTWENWKNHPFVTAGVLFFGVGGALGEGVSAVSASLPNLVVVVVKGVGSVAIENYQDHLNLTDEQVVEYKKKVNMAVDIAKMIYDFRESTKNLSKIDGKSVRNARNSLEKRMMNELGLSRKQAEALMKKVMSRRDMMIDWHYYLDPSLGTQKQENAKELLGIVKDIIDFAKGDE